MTETVDGAIWWPKLNCTRSQCKMSRMFQFPSLDWVVCRFQFCAEFQLKYSRREKYVCCGSIGCYRIGVLWQWEIVLTFFARKQIEMEIVSFNLCDCVWVNESSMQWNHSRAERIYIISIRRWRICPTWHCWTSENAQRIRNKKIWSTCDA